MSITSYPALRPPTTMYVATASFWSPPVHHDKRYLPRTFVACIGIAELAMPMVPPYCQAWALAARLLIFITSLFHLLSLVNQRIMFEAFCEIYFCLF